MCGIAGYYSPNGMVRHEDLELMTDKIAHRGPDSQGFFSDNVVGLGHRRLSIIDLSERANQPMVSSNERYVIIYNGEVYNFREIGARMKSKSQGNNTVQLKTSSDTEVLLEAFAEYGVDFVHHLNGMFAIAIYDKIAEELYLFRDRIGIKPIYYFWDGRTLVFGSELKAITCLEQIPLEINRSAITDFLHLGYIPTPQSIYKDIFKLNSGSYLKVNKNGIEINKYWNLRNKITGKMITEKEQAMVKLSDMLISSVQYQMKSDVPFGVFLSGGIDSSLITAQAVQLSSVKVNTFSIGFEENSHNESVYAKSIATHLGTDHHEFIVSYQDAMDLVDTMFNAYDEPFADSSAIPTMLVSKLAKNYVTVTLSGEGGDELFFGYGAYQWARRLNNPLVKLLRKPAQLIFEQMPNRYKRVAEMLNYSDVSRLRSHIFSQEQYFFSDLEINRIVQPEFLGQSMINETFFSDQILSHHDDTFKRELSVSERKLSAMEMQAIFDLQYYLQDDLLTKVDRASMQFSIETRVPYLDHRVVEFALNLSPNLKYHNGISKYILKEILYQYIPKKYFDRPKQGFAIPLLTWLKGGFKYLISDYLNENIVQKHNVVDYEVVKELISKFEGGTDYLYNRIWLLIVLHKWLESAPKRLKY